MKTFFLSILFIIFGFPSFANDQYTKSDCEYLAKEREYIKKRLNAGYRVREGNRLNERDQELFRVISKHCRKPVDDSAYFYSSQPSQTVTNLVPNYPISSSAINDNWSAHNRVYQGEKLEAWEAFYKMPSRCRHRQSAQADFVFCAENKAEQRQEFEKYWENRVNFSR